MTQMNRREFLGGGTMAALLAGCRTGLWGSWRSQVSVQTFVLRDLLKKDLEGTYAKIGALGVGGVELWELPAFDAKTVRKACLDNGLAVSGAHVLLPLLTKDKFNWTMDYCATVGNRYVAVPWMGPDKDEKDVGGWWRRQADVFNALAERMKPYGVKLGYHNHVHEFTTRFGGKTVWEIFVDNFSKDVMIQWDVGALANCGEDAVAWYRKYPGRCPAVHLRDNWDAKAGYYGVIGEPPPGKTAVDWQGLKAAFAADRPEWFVIEPVTSDRFDTISRSIDNLEGMEIV